MLKRIGVLSLLSLLLVAVLAVALSLLAGGSGRSKMVAVEAITPEDASRRLGL